MESKWDIISVLNDDIFNRRLLCKNCFINHNTELSKKYTKEIYFLDDSE